MNMNKAYFHNKENHKPRWRLIDAKGQVVGRLATQIAKALRGKDRAFFTPHADSGDYVVVINADKVVFTGNKWEDKEYQTYSGWIGGQKTLSAKQVLEKHPEHIIELAVQRMFFRNPLSRQILKKLKVYAGENHPHAAQIAGFAEDKKPSQI